MKKPPELLLKIAAIRPIRAISVDERQVVTLQGGGEVRAPWTELEPFITVGLNGAAGSVARLTPASLKEADLWEQYSARNAEEIAQWEFLSKKYG